MCSAHFPRGRHLDRADRDTRRPDRMERSCSSRDRCGRAIVGPKKQRACNCECARFLVGNKPVHTRVDNNRQNTAVDRRIEQKMRCLRHDSRHFDSLKTSECRRVQKICRLQKFLPLAHLAAVDNSRRGQLFAMRPASQQPPSPPRRAALAASVQARRRLQPPA